MAVMMILVAVLASIAGIAMFFTRSKSVMLAFFALLLLTVGLKGVWDSAKGVPVNWIDVFVMVVLALGIILMGIAIYAKGR